MSRFVGTLDQNTSLRISVAADASLDLLLKQPAFTGSAMVGSTSDGVQLGLLAATPPTRITVDSTGSLAPGPGDLRVQVRGADPLLPAGISFVTLTYTSVTGTTLEGISGGAGFLFQGGLVLGSKAATWQGVDVWLTDDTLPPPLSVNPAGIDLFQFNNVGGVTYGLHRNGPGPMGGPGAIGVPGMAWKGTYVVSATPTTYFVNDTVAYNGQTFICKQQATNQTPIEGSSYWDLVARISPIAPSQPAIGNAGGAAVSAVAFGVTQGAGQVGGGTGTQVPTVESAVLGVGSPAYNTLSWGSNNVLALTAPQLDYLQNTLGIKNIWATASFALAGSAGGTEQWTRDPNVALTGATHSIQNSLRAIMPTLLARGMKVYFSFYNMSYNLLGGMGIGNEWFDNTTWGSVSQSGSTLTGSGVLLALANMVGALKMEGLSGWGFDDVALAGPIANGSTGKIQPTWEWNYNLVSTDGVTVIPNPHTKVDTKAQVKLRGQQVMAAAAAGWNSVTSTHLTTVQQPASESMEFIGTAQFLPGTWFEFIQTVINAAPWDLTEVAATSTQPDFYDGMTSQNNYSRIRLMDGAWLYSDFNGVNNSNEDTARCVAANRSTAWLSQNYSSNWAYLSARFNYSPELWGQPTNGVWLRGGYPAFKALDASSTLTRYQSMRRWGQGGLYTTFINYKDITLPGLPGMTQGYALTTAPASIGATTVILDSLRGFPASGSYSGSIFSDVGVNTYGGTYTITFNGTTTVGVSPALTVAVPSGSYLTVFNVPMPSFNSFSNYRFTNQNYEPSWLAGNAAGIVDTDATGWPSLTYNLPTRSGASITITGTAVDDMAVRCIRWQVVGGGSGMAVHTFVPDTGVAGEPATVAVTSTSQGTVLVPNTATAFNNFRWHTTWTATFACTAGATVLLTVEDIKGRASQYSTQITV